MAGVDFSSVPYLGPADEKMDLYLCIFQYNLLQ